MSFERLETAKQAVIKGFGQRRPFIEPKHLEIKEVNPTRIEYKIRVARNMRILPSVAHLKETQPDAVASKQIQGAGWLLIGSFSYIKDWVQLCGRLTSVDTEEIVRMKIVQVKGHDLATLTNAVTELLDKMEVHYFL